MDCTDADLVTSIYQELRRQAEGLLRSERRNHTLSATGLVHEAYLRLSSPDRRPWQSDAAFHAAASQAMRRILIDHARAKATLKRGGGRVQFDFSETATIGGDGAGWRAVEFDRAFARLEAENAEAAKIVRYRYFCGLSIDATAKLAGISPRRVRTLWTFSRTWLFRELTENDEGSESDDRAKRE